jgi:ParB/RepB/Spo0J family partition protein
MKKQNSPVRNIALSLIDEPPNPLRCDMDDDKLADLERDIRDNGLYYPLIVRARDERYEVIDGHRRLIACRNIGMQTVDCIVHGVSSPPPEAVKLKCNLLREDNTDAEIAVWLGQLAHEHGYTLEQLSETVGRSESWVNDRTDLLRGDPAVLQALGERKINFSQAKVLNRCQNAKWRGLALYHAVTDQIPAARLHDWLMRNAPEIDGAAVVVAAPVPVNGDGAQNVPGIACEFCGGWKDPHNMVNLWLHRWEWTIVQQILSVRQQELAAAATNGQPG